MSLDVLRRLTLVHGIVAWVDALLLITITVMALRARGWEHPWFRRLAITSTLSALIAFASGLALEEHYRFHIRQRLFIASKNLGWLFERKIHFSLGVFAFALIGLGLLFLVQKDERFFRALRLAYGSSAILALLSCVISSIVAAFRAFPE